jgi:hypothetical protein
LFFCKNFDYIAKYIYQYENWTDFTWDTKKINELFGEVKFLQGKFGLSLFTHLTMEIGVLHGQ